MNFNNKTIVIKISGASIKNNKSGIFDKQFIEQFAQSISIIAKNSKSKIILILGGGNIWRGAFDNSIDSSDSDYMGMISTIVNGIYIKNIFFKNNIYSEILSEIPINNIVEKFSISKAKTYLDNEKILICLGGTGKPGYSTDSCAAKKAIELNADYVLFAKNNVDGIYNKDPNIYPDAIKLNKITYNYFIDNNFKIMDMQAAIMLNKKNIDSIIFNFNNPLNINKIFNNKLPYSIITNKKE